MNIKKWIVLIASILLVINLACSNSDNDEETPESAYPTSKNFTEGYTDSTGVVQLDLTSHNVTVTVDNTESVELGGIYVAAFLLENYLFVFAGDTLSEYYPNFTFLPYEAMQAKFGGVFYPYPLNYQYFVEAQTVEVEVGLTLSSVEQDFYAYENEPPYNEVIYSDNWTTPHSSQGNLNDVYLLADSISLGGGLFIHITNNAADSTGADIQTAAVAMDRIESYNEFASLIGLVFQIYGPDSLTMSYLTYSDGSNTIILPTIYISDVTVSIGDFWAQFTLTWGEDPMDLDSHLWTPPINDTSYHICFYRRGDTLSAPYADLDVDDVSSWGPEHITIHQAFSGEYTYAVHHWYGESNIPNSGAQINLVKPDRTVEVFTPPDTTAQAYWYWHVCTINGTTGSVTPIGIISPDPPYPDLLTCGMPKKEQAGK